MTRTSALLVAYLVAAVDPAGAGGLVVGASSPRAIGRAGTATVADDGAGALLANPAAMARRESVHAQLGFAFVDDEIAWQSPNADAPLARNQAASSLAPYGAGFASVRGWIIGVGAMTSVNSQRAFRPPSDVPRPEDFGAAFDYRYAGIAGTFRNNTVTIGVARRLGDAVAVGLALAASRLEIGERRRMWAGFSGRDRIGSPLQDLELGFSGVDPFVPGAVAGVLLAPTGTSIELAASLAWVARARLTAEVNAFGTRPSGPSVVGERPIATLSVAQPVTMRAGARYLADRFVVEIGGDLAIASASSREHTWQVLGLRITDLTGVEVGVERVPSRASLRTHGGLRGALDFELLPGFLWATAGYAFATGSVAGGRQSTSFGDLGGHTVGVGVEATAGGFTFTLGWARTWAVTRRQVPELSLDNPFAAGDATVPAGVFDGSVDQIGIFVDAELGAH